MWDDISYQNQVDLHSMCCVLLEKLSCDFYYAMCILYRNAHCLLRTNFFKYIRQ